MLNLPHTRYNRLHVYFDRAELPPFSDSDLIGTWIEDGMPPSFFISPKMSWSATFAGRATQR
jgi:hypothetical protein